MNALTALVALALSQPVYLGDDGGVLAVDVERAVILLPRTDAGGDVLLRIDGGTWVPTAERIREAQEHAALTERNVYLQDHAGDFPTLWVGIGVGVGVIAGAILGGWVVSQTKK